MLRLAIVVLGCLPLGAVAAPLTITVRPRTQEDRFIEAPILVYLDGEIDAGAPQRVEQALAPIKDEYVWIYFNSPGGSLFSGMEIGRVIRKYGITTVVGTPNPASRYDSRPGECYSACSLAYLGGVYRLGHKGSHYGVHRAHSTTGPSVQDLDLGQVLAAAMGIYIREMGVDPALYDLIASAGPDEIYELSDQEQTSLGVVNNGRQPSEWSIEALEGGMYLRGIQHTLYGMGKAMFLCMDGKMQFISVYDAGPEVASMIVDGGWVHSLLVNRDPLRLADPDTLFEKGGWVTAMFSLTREQGARLMTAKSIGHAMQLSYEAPTFVGYHVDIADASADKVHNFLGNCLANLRQ